MTETNVPKGMKPFNLQEAIAGKPIVCRDGTPAKFLYYSEDFEEDMVVGVSRNRVLQGHLVDGTYLGKGVDSDRDLFMVGEQETVWINVYRDPTGQIFTRSFRNAIVANGSLSAISAEKGLYGTVLLETISRTYDKP